ncbi:MAG: hypothetical protein ACRCRT_03850 [Cetobacterium somerae]
MAWNKVGSVKKVFSKVYSANSGTDSVYLQTGSWENPLLFISSSFIGGAVFGKNITCSGSLSNNGTLSYSTSMKDEKVSLIGNETFTNYNMGNLVRTYSGYNNIMITCTYLSQTGDRYQGDTGLWAKMKVFVDNALVSESPTRSGAIGNFASDKDIGWCGIVSGDQRGQVARGMFYSNFFDTNKTIRVEIDNQTESWSLMGVMLKLEVSTISPSGTELSSNILVTAIEK